MLTILSVLIFIACCLLVLAVLIQNPKGGGLASGFQSGAQVMGVRRTADFLEKATWGLAVGILACSILFTTMQSGDGAVDTPTSDTKDQTGNFNQNGGTGTGGATLPINGGGTPATPPAK